MWIFYLFIATYFLAINFYAFWLIKDLSRETEEAGKAQDGRLAIVGLLGGAIAIYACMFVFRYRLRNLFLMILMPLLAVFNVYLMVLLFRSGWSFFVLARR